MRKVRNLVDDKGRLIYTKEELKSFCVEALYDLVDHAGTKVHLSKMLGLEQSIIMRWMRAGVIVEHEAKKIATHPTLGKLFPIAYLRPDIYWVEQKKNLAKNENS